MANNQLTIKEYVYHADVQKRFMEVATDAELVNFDREAMFAMQQLGKNDYSMGIAQRNPVSVQNAVVNIATIGLSFNPAHKHAYLVPRDNMICLDVSYLGLKYLAEKMGVVKRIDAELVYKNDELLVEDIESKPVHKFSPFEDRGAIVGVYCCATLADGKYKTTFMTLAEITDVQNCSKAKSGPWKKFWQEMAKKTVIKRASKLWPTASEQLNNAIDLINQHEGLEEQEKAPSEESSKQARIELLERENKSLTEKYELLEDIKSLAGKICGNLDVAGKIKFLKDVLGVSNFKELQHCTLPAIQELKKELDQIILTNGE